MITRFEKKLHEVERIWCYDNVFEEFVLSGRERQELKLRGRALMDRAGVLRGGL